MDLFLQACGATGPLQLRLEHPGSSGVECRSFDTPFVVIGRDPQSDLVLEHRDVCPRHAYLQLIGGRLYCVDLGSRSGISLGGQWRRAGWVEPQQAIRIGPYRIRLVIDDGGFFDPETRDDVESSRLTLDLSHRGFKASKCLIAGGLSLVGSSTDCQVRLLDPAVSNVHCSLISTQHGLWVVDLFGKGGIQVNGVPVRQTVLQPCDELRVGRSSIRIRRAVDVGGSRPTFVASSPWPAEEPRTAALATVASTPAQFAIPVEPDPVEEPDTGGAAFWPAVNPDFETEAERESLPPVSSKTRQRPSEEEPPPEAIAAHERRTSCRYPVADVGAVLSWWEQHASPSVILAVPKEEPKLSAAEETIYGRVMARWPGSYNGGTASARATAELARSPLPRIEDSLQSRTCGVRLLDISQTGLLVLSTVVPPADGLIWLRLEAPQATDWVELVIMGTTPATDGAHRLRLAFRDACPYDFFKAVLYKKPGS